MKPGSPLSDVVRRVDLLANQARDFVAPARSLRMSITDRAPSLVLDDGSGAQPFGLTDLVHDQLATLTCVPQAYYRRMQTEDAALLSSNVNAWLGRSSNRQLIRTLHDPSRSLIRAVVSDRFRVIYHQQVLETVLPTLHEQGVKVLSCELTDKRLYLKAVNERVTGEVRVGQVVMAGIVISNSEIGLGALSVESLIYTLACSNGAIVQNNSMRRHHVGSRHEGGDDIQHLLSDEARQADDRALHLRVRDCARAALDHALFRQQVSRLATAASQPLPEGQEEQVVEVTAKRFHLSTTEGAGMLTHLRAGGDFSLWGLSSAVTRFAQDVGSYDRSTELERVGGQIINSAGQLIGLN
jgi:hypothetical protein